MSRWLADIGFDLGGAAQSFYRSLTMADFTTHLSTSSAVGVVYGASGYLHWQMDPATCLIGAALCGLAGMLPDVDSDSGRSQREIMTFAAAVIPMLMLHRFDDMQLTHEQTAVAAGCVYILVRFGFGELFRRYTVHRGMFHSLPAALVAGLTTSLVCSCDDTSMRFFKVTAVVLGYMIHLMLDELWAIEWYRGRLRLKNSFGTAMKLVGNRWFPNVVTYGVLLAVGSLAFQDPALVRYFSPTRDAPLHDSIAETLHTHDVGTTLTR